MSKQSEQSNQNLIDISTTLESWLTKTVKLHSPRSRDIRNDKKKAVSAFFNWIGKSPEIVEPIDVQLWIEKLTMGKLSAGTICNRILMISNYFDYLRQDVGYMKLIPVNPAKAVLPKYPKLYESQTVKALTQQELFALISVIKNYAKTEKPLYLRDYAIFQFLILTGRRREEIVSLKGENIELIDNHIKIRQRVKGGHYVTFELNDETTKETLLKYLKSTRRNKSIFCTSNSLWLRHDIGATNLKYTSVTAHSIARRMKFYAQEAGLRDFHIHRLRHTYASIIANTTGSIVDVQEALGHTDFRTTQIYIKRLKVIKDRYSHFIREAIDLE